MQKFWNWIHDDSGGRVLRLEGPIDAETFWGDEITPQDFRDELYAEDGDLTLWINSPGGNVFAAAEIYTMIRDYPHNVTVKIASIAASAASVIAMAGNTVQMSPTALLMIHDPSTIAFGNAKDTVSSVMNTIQSVVTSIWENVKTAVFQKITAIKDTVVNGFNAAVSFIKGLASQAFSWGADIINGIVNGIRNSIGNVSGAVRDVADTIRSYLHFSVPDEGPLTDFESWMPDFLKGLADGLEGNASVVTNSGWHHVNR